MPYNEKTYLEKQEEDKMWRIAPQEKLNPTGPTESVITYIQLPTSYVDFE
jgi:hypothetical protein